MQQVKKPKTADEQEQDRIREEYRWVLSSKVGRRFLWRILGDTGIFETSFSQHNGQMSHNEGRRSVGLEVLLRINEAHIENFFNMMRENKERVDAQRERDNKSDADANTDAPDDTFV
jgi:hypothetical protein